jgi:glycerol-3-phosphate dehydrogenase
MQRNPSQLQRREFDLLVIGGGITGACVAHDATLRGLSVALIEQRDFGSATSAASSRILHNGIRYLQQFRLGKARESARERSAFMRIAPHLTRDVPFLIPIYRGSSIGKWLLRMGTTVHSLATRDLDAVRDGTARAPAVEFITREECLRRVPSLDPTGLRGGCVIRECQMISSERMTLAFLLSADAGGATIVNYMPAVRLLGDGSRITGAVARDAVSGAESTISARVVLQAMGPWGGLPLPNRTGTVPPRARWNAKGVHVITRSITPDCAVVLRSTHQSRGIVGRGGRHLFVQPWHGHSLIGTTNDPFQGTPDVVTPCAEDAAGLLADINAALPGARLTERDIKHAYAGLFPNTVNPSRPEIYQATGDYEVMDHARSERVEGLVSLLSMKYTTARVLAERAIDLVIRKLGKPAIACRTHETPLIGGDITSVEQLVGRYRKTYPELDDEIVRHLVAQHGTRLPEMLGAVRTPAAKRLRASQAITEADVHHAVTAESAIHLDDVVFRRTALAVLGPPSSECLYRCASIMGSYLGWSRAQIDAEVTRTLDAFPLVAPRMASP